MGFKRALDEGCFVAGLTALLFLAGIILLPSYMLAQAPEVSHRSVTHNTWTSGAPLPTPVSSSTAAVIANDIYVVGGNDAAGTGASGMVLAPMPQGSVFGNSAVYKGQLYCFGGWASWQGTPIDNVQIYQP